MKNWLRKLFDHHAILFWILSLFVFYFLLYKLPAMTIFEGDDSALATLRYAVAFLMILYVKWIYDNELTMGFRKEHFGRGFLWITLLMLFSLFTHFCAEFPHVVYADSLVYGLVLFFGVGLLEETMVRGFLLNTMMQHWKDDPKRAGKSLFWSSLTFGILHLGNLFTDGFWYLTVLQVIAATAVGFAFGGVYLRTKNLWPGVIMHCLVDFFTMFTMVTVPLSQDGGDLLAGGFAWYHAAFADGIGPAMMFIGHALAIVLGFVLIRKSKRAEIDRVWAETSDTAESTVSK